MECVQITGNIGTKWVKDSSSNFASIINSFKDGGPYEIETSPLICRGNQWTVFYMIGTSS